MAGVALRRDDRRRTQHRVGLVVLLAMWGSGAERWLGLVILAIIVFGLFVVGAPWGGPSAIGNFLR
jgi:hypothetical protein